MDARLNLNDWGGLPALLANCGRIDEDGVVGLTSAEADSLRERADCAARSLAFVLETVGRLMEANETADKVYRVEAPAVTRLCAVMAREFGGTLETADKVYRVEAPAVTRLCAVMAREFGGTLRELGEINARLVFQTAYRAGFDDCARNAAAEAAEAQKGGGHG